MSGTGAVYDSTGCHLCVFGVGGWGEGRGRWSVVTDEWSFDDFQLFEH
jgi:hypothetical protein